MKKRKVLIIGGGIAGLSAGSYLVRNGYDSEIFEAHTRPGGVCTSWKRGDYIFDYCIHWLVGTSSGTGYDCVWKELGMLEDEQVAQGGARIEKLSYGGTMDNPRRRDPACRAGRT